jgi:hypothetical protein
LFAFQIVYEDNDSENLITADTLKIVYDGKIAQHTVIQLMKNAVSEMEHPRTANAIGKVTTVYGFIPKLNDVVVIDDCVAPSSLILTTGAKRKVSF